MVVVRLRKLLSNTRKSEHNLGEEKWGCAGGVSPPKHDWHRLGGEDARRALGTSERQPFYFEGQMTSRLLIALLR